MKTSTFVSAILIAYFGICIVNAQENVARAYNTAEPTPTPTYTTEPWDWNTEEVYKNCENKCLLCYECEEVYQFPYFEFIQFLYNFGPSQQATPTPTPTSSYQRQSWKQQIRTYLGSSSAYGYSNVPTSEVSNEYYGGYGYDTSSSWGYGENSYNTQPSCSAAPKIPTFFKKCYWGCYGCLKCLLEYGYHFQIPTYVWSEDYSSYSQPTPYYTTSSY